MRVTIQVTTGSLYSLRKQREIGLIDHATIVWIGKKEKCGDHAMHFTRVGITESKPAFVVLLIGMAIAIVLFSIEMGKIVVERSKYFKVMKP